MVDFSAYLSKPTGEIQAPKALPEGHYYGRWTDHKTRESQNHKPMLSVTYTLDSAGDDVDQSLLPEKGVSGRKVTNNYMLDADFGIFQLKESIAATGVQMDPAQGIGVYLDQCKNQPVKLYIKSRKLDQNDPESREVDDVNKVLPANA